MASSKSTRIIALKRAGVAQRRLAKEGSSRKRSRASGVVDISGRCCQVKGGSGYLSRY